MSTESDYSKYSGIYADLAKLVGEENTKRIYMHFKGQQVNFSMRLYSANHVIEIAKDEKNRTIREVANEFGYSERHLKRLMMKQKNKDG